LAARPSHAQPLPLFAGWIYLIIGLALLLDNLGVISLQGSDLVALVIVAVGIATIGLAISRVVPSRR
jgi:hypothetical protein